MADTPAAGRMVRAAKNGGIEAARASMPRWSAEAEVRFLAVLGESGSVTAAAAASGFSKLTVYRRRRRCPAFAVQWDAVLAQAPDWRRAPASRARGAGGLRMGLPQGQALQDEAAAAQSGAAGRIVQPAKNGRTKVVRVPSTRWSDAAEERFLALLGETCNVRAAAAAVGFSTTAIYQRRARWPGFAALWDAAIAQGYARLEARLVELATDSLRGGDRGGELPDVEDDGGTPPKMTVGEAMNLLRLHRASVRGGAPQRYDARRVAPDAEAARASILRKIAALERAEAKGDSRG